MAVQQSIKAVQQRIEGETAACSQEHSTAGHRVPQLHSSEEARRFARPRVPPCSPQYSCLKAGQLCQVQNAGRQGGQVAQQCQPVLAHSLHGGGWAEGGRM